MKISEVIVVEGKNDVEKVKSAVDAFVVSTSGSHLSHSLIKMLKVFNKERGRILFFDPEFEGEKIRALISEAIPNVKHAFVLKEDSTKNNDIGVEHASVETIKNSLSKVVSYNEIVSDLEYSHLLDYGLISNVDSKALRAKLCNYLNITYSNSKTLYKRLLMLNISKDTLKLIMENLND